MATRRAASAAAKQPVKATRAQLDRILSSTTFQQVDRLKRFLNFIVSEHLEGRSDELKEYVVGVQVFGKEPSFDPRTDPIVRVQARRLRARLERYYATEGEHDELIVELPKGGYAPVIRHREIRQETRRSLGASLTSRNTIAVLAFADNSAEGNLRHFANSLRQEIVHGLTRFRSLRVVATEPRETFGDLRDVGVQLHAAVLIKGSVRRSGDTLRVTAQVIDTGSGSYVWSEAVDVPATDLASAPERSRAT